MAKPAKKAATKRWKYCLNGLLLILPIWYLYHQMNPTFPEPLEQKDIGPFTVQPMPLNNEAAYDYGGGYLKDFSLTFCEGCTDKIRYAYMSVGESPAPMPEGVDGVIHGASDLKHAHAPFPEQVTESDKLWVTVQDWQGKSYHAFWDLK
ncbi:hypothetical protein [Kangiella shandongensis]|uniref:hypothetical protein n=1 Tax=Kangiella shandongensis TaxID=2763258 RepID=UPI001CBFF82A|nr:hypothetical protein [Kangiella shandongensis]